MDLKEMDPVTCTGLVRLGVEQVAVEGLLLFPFRFFFRNLQLTKTKF